MNVDFAAVRARGVADVARQLGLEVHQAGKHLGPCPACSALKRHASRKDRRGAVGITPDGEGWRCHECDEGGDAIALACWVVVGRRQPITPDAWIRVREALADIVGAPPPAPASVPRPSRRPPSAEVATLWRASYTLDAVPSDVEPEWTGDVREYLGRVRRLELGWLLGADLARVLPPPTRYAYPAWWPAHWPKTWRLAVAAYEPDGALASVHARAIVDGVAAKTLWPRDCSATGLLFADRVGLALLRGESAGVDRVVITEGLTDTLAMAEALERRSPRRTAVLGGTSGCWSALAAVRWPPACTVVLAVDHDAAGDKHAGEILKALPPSIGTPRRIDWARTGAA